MNRLVRLATLTTLIATSPAARASGETGRDIDIEFRSETGTDTLPAGWQIIPITPRKTPTQYSVETLGEKLALHAVARKSASAIGYPLKLDIHQTPWIEWDWMPASVLVRADNAVAAREDSVLRLVLAFDGDRSELPLHDRLTMKLARAISGAELPYATLMYIWNPGGESGRVIANPYTHRVQMLIASTMPGIGMWQHLRRNLLEDYRRVFGEEPGNLVAVGVMTDSDNTGDMAEAWYGAIHLHATH